MAKERCHEFTVAKESFAIESIFRVQAFYFTRKPALLPGWAWYIPAEFLKNTGWDLPAFCMIDCGHISYFLWLFHFLFHMIYSALSVIINHYKRENASSKNHKHRINPLTFGCAEFENGFFSIVAYHIRFIMVVVSCVLWYELSLVLILIFCIWWYRIFVTLIPC